MLLSVTAAGGVSDRRAGSARPAQANRHYGQGNRDHDSGSDAPGGRNGCHCQQQGNGFDCGVACLLYAEKCGQALEREDIGAGTDQLAITWYRALLQRYLQQLAGG